MAATLPQLVKVKSIRLTRAEGTKEEVGRPIELERRGLVDVWEAADKVLAGWATTAPKLGYHKVDFKITFEDGQSYSGRYDLKYISIEYPNLSKHVYNFVRFSAGQWPGALSSEEYSKLITQKPWVEQKEKWADFLKKYDIGGLNISARTFVTIIDPGKTTFKRGEVVSPEAFETENERVRKLGEKPATGTTKPEELQWGKGGNGGTDLEQEYLARSGYHGPLESLAKTEGDPLRKFCCKICGECAPKELLEEGKFLERISWLREHYKSQHPGIWGQAETVLEPARRGKRDTDLDYMSDSPEFVAQTIEQSGWRERLDREFQLAIQKARRGE